MPRPTWALACIIPLAACLASADLPDPRPVACQAIDGLLISADYYPPSRANKRSPIVILLHGRGESRAIWAPLIPSLREAGMAVLVIDLRGHGHSVSEDTRNRLRDHDPGLGPEMYRDLRAAYDWLSTQPEIDRSRLALLGVELGGAVALHYAGHDRSVDALVIIDPARERLGLDCRSDVAKIRGRPVLFVTGAAPAGREAARELSSLSPDTGVVSVAGETADVAGVAGDARVRERVIELLRANVGRPSQNVVYGSINSAVYHLEGSGWIERIAATNLRYYSSPQEAEARGLRKALNRGPRKDEAEGAPPKPAPPRAPRRG